MMLFYFIIICVAFYQSVKYCLRRYQPAILNFMMKRVHSRIVDMKTALFAEVFELVAAKKQQQPDQVKESSDKSKTNRLKVLEIGVGTGENFKYYPRNASITVLDKTDKFKEYYEQSLITHKRADLRVSELIVSRAEDMSSIETESMDVVLHTFLLCSVDDRRKVLAEVERVLKPGGVSVFVEHSADVVDRRRMLVQKCIEPWLGDCSFVNMRETLEEAQTTGLFSEVHVRDYFLHSALLYFLNPIVYGYARKKRI